MDSNLSIILSYVWCSPSHKIYNCLLYALNKFDWGSSKERIIKWIVLSVFITLFCISDNVYCLLLSQLIFPDKIRPYQHKTPHKYDTESSLGDFFFQDQSVNNTTQRFVTNCGLRNRGLSVEQWSARPRGFQTQLRHPPPGKQGPEFQDKDLN